MKILSTLALALALSTAAFAQQPTLTETEQLKIQILNLQYALKAEQEKSASLTVVYGQCTTTLLKDGSELQKATTQLQDEINKNHEGFSFDITTGKFEPKAPKPVEKK